MERLAMDRIRDVIHRLRLGDSERRIARDTGLSRGVVRKYHQWAKKQGYLDASRPLPDEPALYEVLGESPSPPAQQSSVEPFAEVVKDLLDQGCQMTAICARLQQDHGFTGSYSAVRRFVHRIRPKEPDVTVRVSTAPGEEAQVDFGSVGMLRDPQSGEMRAAYVFVATLSYSRHQYAELVFDQKSPTWIALHRHAFESWEGVPKRVVPDNLKAAVRKAALYDPIPSKAYRSMAVHYGFAISPTRPHTPQHKGKVENGVKYVKNNFMDGQEFTDINVANQRLKVWVRETAGRRIHGTTREQPLARFERKEKAALRPLNKAPFELCEIRLAKVHKDCHIQVYNSRYSVPWKFVAEKVEVHIYQKTVQIFDNDNHELLATHLRAEREGTTRTIMEHYPEELCQYLLLRDSVCQKKARDVGPATTQVVEFLLADHPVDHLRQVQGLLKLTQSVGPERVEAACKRALHYENVHYRSIKEILNKALDRDPLPDEETKPPVSEHTFARSADEFFPPDPEEEER